jgi:hypothetical protein
VTYSDLFVAATISSTDQPVWQWLAKGSGRIAGLSLELYVNLLDADATENAVQVSAWQQPLQTLFGIPGIQVRVTMVGAISDRDHPFIDQWLKQYGQLISQLYAKVDASEDRLKLRELSEAAAPCRSIDLEVWHSSSQVVDLADLIPVAHSIRHLICHSGLVHGSWRGASSCNRFSPS